MSLLRKLFVLGVAAWSFLPFSSRAQDFGLSVTAVPSPVVVNNPILYTINVTNLLNFQLENVFVTNAISGPVIINEATSSEPGATFTNSVAIVFRINTLIAGDIAQLTLSLSPIEGGPFTNHISVTAVLRTNVVTTNIVTQVNFPPGDLGVSMTSAPNVFTNDTTTIGLSVTNLGPSVATGVVVTNSLPTSFRLLSVAPPGASNSFSGGNLVLNLGALTSGSSTQLVVTVQPTNAATFQLRASVSAANIQDTNTANNSVTNTMVVGTFLPINASINVLSEQMNWQSGLWEMLLQVVNNAGTNVPAFRLFVSGLTNNTWLYNATGTNAGEPYVQHNAPLLASSSTNVLLEFYTLIRAPITNLTFQIEGLTATPLIAPTNFNISISTNAMVPGGFLIEFPATIGKTYTIIYANNPSFSNAQPAQPSIVAPATRVQWIDSGPPKTISHPSSTGSRFYRVLQAP